MLLYNCAELFQQENKRGGARGMKEPKPLELARYDRLHNEGKRLIRSWLNRAWMHWERRNQEVFEPFIFAWFAFNSWAACVTDTDKDADIMDALAADREMNESFAAFIEQPDSVVAINAKIFFDLLPIFDAKALNRNHLLHFNDEDSRAERIAYYFDRGADAFEPKCWKHHVDSSEAVPLDWAHILKAIYKVRCNLFHGQKMAHSEMDRQIVLAAFLTLVNFVHEGGYLSKHEIKRQKRQQ